MEYNMEMNFKDLESVKRYFEMFGFKEYKNHLLEADIMLQKCIYDNVTGQKNYFINIYIYDLSSRYSITAKIMYEAQCQFKLDESSTVNITFFGKNHSNYDIHEFFRKFYKDFNCLPSNRH